MNSIHRHFTINDFWCLIVTIHPFQSDSRVFGTVGKSYSLAIKIVWTWSTYRKAVLERPILSEIKPNGHLNSPSFRLEWMDPGPPAQCQDAIPTSTTYLWILYPRPQFWDPWLSILWYLGNEPTSSLSWLPESDRLQNFISEHAFYDSMARFPPPRCYPKPALKFWR